MILWVGRGSRDDCTTSHQALRQVAFRGIVFSMALNNMPATEATVGDEMSYYEFAFHLLPTVADEEVPAAFGDLKAMIDREGGHITSEEAPQRFDLAYTVVTHSEGKNFKYNHSYFGWVRFMTEPSKLENLKTEIAHESRVFRHLLIKLTKAEMEHPFKTFEIKTKRKTEAKDEATPEKTEAPKEVNEADIEKAVEGITQ